MRLPRAAGAIARPLSRPWALTAPRRLTGLEAMTGPWRPTGLGARQGAIAGITLAGATARARP